MRERNDRSQFQGHATPHAYPHVDRLQIASLQRSNDLTVDRMRVNPYSCGSPLQPQGTIVSNTASSSLRIKPANPEVLDLLRELFKATPLYIFAMALKDARAQR